jgi:hypothetical protein
MKHLKKFEELNISTYLKAGELLRKSHSKRGDKMIDWAMKGELGKTPELNMWIKWMNDYDPRGGRLGMKKGIVSDLPLKVKIDSIHVSLDSLSDDIDYHKEENNFPFSISLGFKIDESELEKTKPEYIKSVKDECKYSSGFRLYPMELYVNFKIDENGHIAENPKLNFFSYNEIGAMFSDRKSANNFKTILKKVLTNEIRVYTYYKDEDDGSPMTNSEVIFDRIPKLIPTIDISDIEIILDTFKNINTNSLYAEDPNDALKRISS